MSWYGAEEGRPRLDAIAGDSQAADGSRWEQIERCRGAAATLSVSVEGELELAICIFPSVLAQNDEQWAAGGTSEKRKSTCRGGLGKFEEALGPLAYVRFPAETWLGAGAKPGIMIGARTFVDRNE